MEKNGDSIIIHMRTALFQIENDFFLDRIGAHMQRSFFFLNLPTALLNQIIVIKLFA